MSETIEGETQKSIDFLKKWKSDGPWNLMAISPDRKSIDSATLTTTEAAFSWVEKHNGKMNIYFLVNTPTDAFNQKDDPKNKKKAGKVDIESANWLHVDVDPEDNADVDDEQRRILDLFTDRLPKGIPDPTVIIYSGGGFQAFWKLRTPYKLEGTVTKCEEFELYNKRMEQVFQGDHCHNVDRIMRLPGTINIPDAKKRKKGRTEKLARLIQFNNKQYEIDDFKRAQSVQTSSDGVGSTHAGTTLDIPGNIERVQDVSELDEWNVPDRVKVIMVQGHHPDQPKEKDNSRSAWLFDFVCSLARCGVPDGVIYAIVTDPEWGISSSVVELKGGGDRYARRQIQRAKEYSEDPNLTFMNDRHAVIGNISGKCVVIEEMPDDVLKRAKLTMSSFDNIKNRYSHMRVVVGQTKDG